MPQRRSSEDRDHRLRRREFALGRARAPQTRRRNRARGRATTGRGRKSDRAARRWPFRRVRRRLARTQPHRIAARRLRVRRADSRHLPRLAGDVRVKRGSAGRARPRLFPRRSPRAADQREIAAHRLESSAPRARKRAPARHSARRILLFRAFLRRSRCRRADGRGVRSWSLVRCRDRAERICAACSSIPEKSGETGARVLQNFLESVQ